MSAGAAIISAYYTRIKRRFLDEDAIMPSKTLDIGTFPIYEQRYIRRWASKGIFVEADPGRYYLDTARARDEERSANRRGFIYFVILLLVSLIVITAIHALMSGAWRAPRKLEWFKS